MSRKKPDLKTIQEINIGRSIDVYDEMLARKKEKRMNSRRMTMGEQCIYQNISPDDLLETTLDKFKTKEPTRKKN
jgi:hypothetical protein